MTVNDSHDPTVLPPVTQPLFSIQEEATEPVWTFWKHRNLNSLTRNQIQHCAACNLVTTPTELSQLLVTTQ